MDMNAATKTPTTISTSAGRDAAKRILDAAEGWECAGIIINFNSNTSDYRVSVAHDGISTILCLNFFVDGIQAELENGQRFPISADRAVALITTRREIFIAWRALAEAERAFVGVSFSARFCEDEAA